MPWQRGGRLGGLRPRGGRGGKGGRLWGGKWAGGAATAAEGWGPLRLGASGGPPKGDEGGWSLGGRQGQSGEQASRAGCEVGGCRIVGCRPLDFHPPAHKKSMAAALYIYIYLESAIF